MDYGLRRRPADPNAPRVPLIRSSAWLMSAGATIPASWPSANVEDRWHIRDWGRGLRYEHLTQNENKEKLAHPDQVVGKFGVGLKDALATFDRHRIAVAIRSRHGDITTGKQAKHGFDDIKTLHALITDPAEPGFTGTEFILSGHTLTKRQIDEAKGLFLRYSGDEELGVTPFGSVLGRTSCRTPSAARPT